MTQRRLDQYNGELNQTYIANQQRLRSEQVCQITRAVFTITGQAKVKEYRPRWTADRDYLIRSVLATAGNHVPYDEDDPKSHPDDGCPKGADLVIQMMKYPSNYDDGIGEPERLFRDGGRVRIPASKHRDNAWQKDIRESAKSFLEDEWLTVKIIHIGGTYPGDSIVVTVTLEPA